MTIRLPGRLYYNTHLCQILFRRTSKFSRLCFSVQTKLDISSFFKASVWVILRRDSWRKTENSTYFALHSDQSLWLCDGLEDQCVLISVCMAVCCPDWDVTSLQQRRRGGRERTQGGRMRIHNLIRLLPTIQQPTWKGLEIHWVDYYTDHSFDMSSHFASKRAISPWMSPIWPRDRLMQGRWAKAPSPVIFMLIQRWPIDHWPAQDNAHIQTSRCRPSSAIEVNSLIAACSSFLCTLRPKTASPPSETPVPPAPAHLLVSHLSPQMYLRRPSC